MGITRKLPNSIFTRDLALGRAKGKNDSLAPGVIVLNPATVINLDATSPAYHSARWAVTIAEGVLKDNTIIKDPAIANTHIWVSHFIQVFNLGVARHVYTPGQRGYYLLDPDSEALPELNTDTLVTGWAKQLELGDPERIAAGGAPMVNPTIAEVNAFAAISFPLYTTQNSLTEILDAKREIVENMNPATDTLIKRIWDEVEAYYGGEPPESKRLNARLWGVVYVTTGPPATVTGLVKDGTGAAREGATVTIDETGAVSTANNEGRYTEETHVLGHIHLRASFPGKTDVVVEVEIPEHEGAITIEVPDIIIP